MEWFDKLKDLRKEKSKTLKQVSSELSLPLQTYAAYEHGTREPSFEMLKQLCDYFDVSADYLLGRTEY